MDTATRPTRRLASRSKIEATIVAEAVHVFAECGYEGASIAAVAENAGLSKQNLMYYYPTKQALYQRVLDGVLDDWLERMASLADPSRDPGDVLCGAQLYGEQIKKRVVPLVRKDIEVFERWIAEGRIARVNATHLLFAIWAMTQSYADFAAQMRLVLDREQLTQQDFDDAENLIASMVLRAVGLGD
jgi:TetR/AcrR family transcriptional regulator